MPTAKTKQGELVEADDQETANLFAEALNFDRELKQKKNRTI